MKSFDLVVVLNGKFKIFVSKTMFFLCLVYQTRLQAQAAGVAYSHPLSNIMNRMAYFGPKTVSVL